MFKCRYTQVFSKEQNRGTMPEAPQPEGYAVYVHVCAHACVCMCERVCVCVCACMCDSRTFLGEQTWARFLQTLLLVFEG